MKPGYFAERTRTDANGCWNWQLSVDKAGYGRCKVQVQGKNALSPHIAAYRHFVGEVPAGLEIDHTCRNTLCCNPRHLEAVTRPENARRASIAQTHCKHGHPFIPSNTYIWRGIRNCRTCRRRINSERQR